MAITRREFLIGSAAVYVSSKYVSSSEENVVNDIHSQLNRTVVDRIITPTNASELQGAIQQANAARKAVSIGGGRHAMGGQQFGTGTVLLDMRQMNRTLDFDTERGVIEVEAGAFWPELIHGYLERQKGQQKQWGLAQKQTGADRLSIGGTVAANAHGRGLTMKPFVNNIESFTLVNAQGELISCSREQTGWWQEDMGCLAPWPP